MHPNYLTSNDVLQIYFKYVYYNSAYRSTNPPPAPASSQADIIKYRYDICTKVYNDLMSDADVDYTSDLLFRNFESFIEEQLVKNHYQRNLDLTENNIIVII